MKYVYLVLLAVVSIIHLIDSYRDDAEKRKRTKGFLLPLILLYYLSSADVFSVPLIIALVTSWVGDVFLMLKGNKWFIVGGVGFLIAHLSFIITYCLKINFSNVIWYIVIPVALIYFTVTALIIRSILPNTPKKMIVPMFSYLIGNSLMNTFALMLLVSEFSIGTAVAYVGAILFFVSDCTLFLVRYHKNENLIFKKHFTVMLTYIIGELLITQGILMLA